jgi:hypothetical protein
MPATGRSLVLSSEGGPCVAGVGEEVSEELGAVVVGAGVERGLGCAGVGTALAVEREHVSGAR